MGFKLNCSPHRDLIDIIPRLFNLKKLSDVQFIVEDRTIWAHSLVLMGRSEVFEEQMVATCGEKKLIPVDGCKYDSFLEFIRYLYTDACEINEKNGLDLVKLAVKYRVIKLENQVLNSLNSDKWNLQVFNYAVVNKYNFARNHAFGAIGKTDLELADFVNLHPDALNELLKCNKISPEVTEIQIFNAVAKWLNSYCETHHMSISEARQKFDKLIRNIRFPTMSQDELKQCTKILPGLLNDCDLMLISKQILFGGDDDVWISKCRESGLGLYEWTKFTGETVFKTTLTVFRPTVLYGLRIGIEFQRKAIQIEISTENGGKSLTFTQNSPETYWIELLISLGESIILKPGIEYEIKIKYLELTDSNITVLCRNKTTDIILDDSNNPVWITKAGANMMEMFFKPGVMP